MNGYIDSNRIAERIKHVRISRGLTQLEMGDKLGYSERQVRRLETEGTLNLGVINLISEVFNISCKDILFDEEDVFLCMSVMVQILIMRIRRITSITKYSIFPFLTNNYYLQGYTAWNSLLAVPFCKNEYPYIYLISNFYLFFCKNI